MHANFSARLLFSRGRLKTFDGYVSLGSLSVEMLFEQLRAKFNTVDNSTRCAKFGKSHNCIFLHVKVMLFFLLLSLLGVS